jgi:threonine dehydratase
MIPFEWIQEAAERITPYIKRTPLAYDKLNDLYLKWENHQLTGSFKVRGAFNKILCLESWERQRGLVTASAGNHGQGVALAGRETGVPVTVFASEHAVPKKLEAMRALGARIELVQGRYGDAEVAGMKFAAENRSTWVSPYNDGQVIAGQGTIGLEVLDDLTDSTAATWIAPVGGGGLASGIGASLFARQEATSNHQLVGVQSEASPFMYDYFHRNSVEGTVELPSIADGLAGDVEEHSLTIPMLRSYASNIVLVSEAQTASAIRYCWQRYHEKIEGSSATALAAALYGKVKQRPAVVIISGGNISDELFREVVGES